MELLHQRSFFIRCPDPCPPPLCPPPLSCTEMFHLQCQRIPKKLEEHTTNSRVGKTVEWFSKSFLPPAFTEEHLEASEGIFKTLKDARANQPIHKYVINSSVKWNSFYKIGTDSIEVVLALKFEMKLKFVIKWCYWWNLRFELNIMRGCWLKN